MLRSLCAVLLCAGVCAGAGAGGASRAYLPPPPTCDPSPKREFTDNLYQFSSQLYKRAAVENDYHFVVSQYSVWRGLAALVEGPGGEETRRELRGVLKLPEAKCSRDSYYRLAAGLESNGQDATFTRTRVLVQRDDLPPPDDGWVEEAKKKGLLDAVVRVSRSSAASQLQKLVGSPDSWPTNQDLKLDSRRSVLVDSMDFRGAFKVAFPVTGTEVDAVFYDKAGRPAGHVDMMSTVVSARLSALPALNSDGMELPLGRDSRYSLLVLLPRTNDTVPHVVDEFPDDIITHILRAGRVVPAVRVAVPRFSIRTTGEASGALRSLGVTELWGGDVQAVLLRATIAVGESGTAPPPAHAAAPTASFVLNRPFLFAVIDKQTDTCLLTGAYSRPPDSCRRY